MKKTLLLLFLSLNFSSFAQDKKRYEDNFSLLKSEVKAFIDTVKTLSIGKGKYTVYTVYMHNTFPDTNSICFVISYIETRPDYLYPFTPHWFSIDDDIVLVSNQKSIPEEWESRKYLELVDSVARVKIKNKLCTCLIDDGGEYDKELIWYDGNTTRKRFCRIQRSDIHISNDLAEFSCCSFSDFMEVKLSFDKKRYDSIKKEHEFKQVLIPDMPPLVK